MCPIFQEAPSSVTDFQNDQLMNVYGFVTVVTVTPYNVQLFLMNNSSSFLLSKNYPHF